MSLNAAYPFLDFFAGCGLAAEALKGEFRAVWANDICPKKGLVFTANHGSGHFHLGSVEDCNGDGLPDAILSWASFPCQDLSLAGAMQGIDGDRSGLVWRWLESVDQMDRAGKKPLIVAAENVAGLVSAGQGAYYRALHRALSDRGYKVGPVLLNADRWTPQSRPRVFVVGADKRLDLSGLVDSAPNWTHPLALLRAVSGVDPVLWRLPLPPPRKTVLSDILDFSAPCQPRQMAKHNLGLIPEAHFARLLREVEKGLRAAPGYKRTRKQGQQLELRFDGLAGCIRTPKGGSSRQFLIMARPDGRFDTRLLTVREAARLMGVRDSYKLPGVTDEHSIKGSYNDGYMAMGDAVAVPAVRFLSRNLLSRLAARA